MLFRFTSQKTAVLNIFFNYYFLSCFFFCYYLLHSSAYNFSLVLLVFETPLSIPFVDRTKRPLNGMVGQQGCLWNPRGGWEIGRIFVDYHYGSGQCSWTSLLTSSPTLPSPSQPSPVVAPRDHAFGVRLFDVLEYEDFPSKTLPIIECSLNNKRNQVSHCEMHSSFMEKLLMKE